MTIYEKLLNIQAELKAPKSQYNSFGKYNYRSCEDILEAIKPLCEKNKTVLTISDEIITVGNRYYVKATATLTDVENPNDHITNTAFAREEEDKKGMDGSQVTGASSSYARKYALNGLFSIDDTKDSDTTNNGAAPTGKKKTVKLSADIDEATAKVIGDIKAEIEAKLKAGVEKKVVGKTLREICGTVEYTTIDNVETANKTLNAIKNLEV